MSKIAYMECEDVCQCKLRPSQIRQEIRIVIVDEKERVDTKAQYYRLVQRAATTSGRTVEEIIKLDDPIARIRAGLPIPETEGSLDRQNGTKAKNTIDHTVPHLFPDPFDQVVFDCQSRYLNSPYLKHPFKLSPVKSKILDLFVPQPFIVIKYPQLEKICTKKGIYSHISRLRGDLISVLENAGFLNPELFPNTAEVGWSLFSVPLEDRT